MDIRKGQLVELEIGDVAFGGKGLSKVDGLAIFVDAVAPSDRVMARITRRKKSYAEAKVVEMLTPSPLRVTPPCRYSEYCGGCKWQFLDYEAQVRFKQQHVAESIEHIGLIKGVTVHPAIPSEKIFGYRNKMEFSCSDRRWLMPEEMEQGETDSGFAIGLHVPGTYYKVLDTEKCHLQPDMGNVILDEARRYMRASELPVYGLKSHEGFWRFLMLRHSVAHDQWMVNIITSAENRAAVQPLADLLMANHPEIVSVVNNITASRAGIAVGEYEILLAGEPVLRDKIGDYTFEISANSFFQTNTRGAARLYETVKNYAGLTGNEQVLDLYCGTGTISICLSGAAREVVGMELVESSVADARRNCEVNGISNCRFISGDIKDCLSQAGFVPDVMIIDPPRAGMHKDVVRQVLEMGPERIVYVSCNPATLARDLLMLKEAYEVMEVQPVDMFPHTFHIESVARLERRRSA